MLLIAENDFPDLECPHCGSGIDVMTTYEDSISEINSKGTCPHCEQGIDVWTVTEFRCIPLDE